MVFIYIRNFKVFPFLIAPSVHIVLLLYQLVQNVVNHIIYQLSLFSYGFKVSEIKLYTMITLTFIGSSISFNNQRRTKIFVSKSLSLRDFPSDALQDLPSYLKFYSFPVSGHSSCGRN